MRSSAMVDSPIGYSYGKEVMVLKFPFIIPTKCLIYIIIIHQPDNSESNVLLSFHRNLLLVWIASFLAMTET